MTNFTKQEVMDIFPWDRHFNTGIEEIDVQHKKLVGLINLLAKHVAFKSDAPTLHEIFTELADYTVYHFQTEEEIWHKYLPDDPLNSEHKHSHNNLIDELNELKKRFDTVTTIDIMESLLPFLTRWLVSHILESDRQVAMVVLAIQDGLTIDQAKKYAEDMTHDTARIITKVTLSVFDSLSNNTLQLMQEISERKKFQKIEQFRNRILELLINDSPVSSILKEVIGGVEELNPNAMCSILMLDEEGKHLVSGIAPKLPKLFNEAIDGIEIGLGVGSCGTAAYTGERVVVEDISVHPFWEPYRELAEQSGLQACWSQPIFTVSSNKVIGTFAIYHKTPYAPTDKNITLIEEAAKLVSLSIDQAYSKQELRIAATAFQSQEGVLITDIHGVIIKVNKAFTRITGYGAKEAIGYKPDLLKSGQHTTRFYNDMWMKIQRLGFWSDEIWNKRKNGEIYPANLTVTAVEDDTHVITHYVGTIVDISERKASEEAISRLAFFDPLTQLPNRRMLLDKLSQSIEIGEKNDHIGALLFLDIDHFKILNDMHGHDLGDVLLQQIAKRLEISIANNGIIGRLGGDEFVIILGNLSKDTGKAATEASVIADKILYVLNQPYHLNHLEYNSSISIGVTTFRGGKFNTSELMKQADIAMYQAKQAGRNTIRFFDPIMHENLLDRIKLEKDIQLAIDEKQFELYYQVQVDRSGRPVGSEALIRWNHPERGLLSPIEFIPLAEEKGLIIPIGEWVLDTACRQISLWKKNKTTRNLALSINISAKQIHQVDFVNLVKSSVNKYNINPDQLKIELTETLLLDDIDKAISIMNDLEGFGIKLSLDDFGTGYSSLQYLKNLPLYELKIDRSFINDLEQDISDQAIVKTIIAMADSLSLTVIAEGVETKEQMNYLLSQGCTKFQGYLFSKPIPIGEFAKFIASEMIITPYSNISF